MVAESKAYYLGVKDGGVLSEIRLLLDRIRESFLCERVSYGTNETQALRSDEA